MKERWGDWEITRETRRENGVGEKKEKMKNERTV